MAQVLKRKSWGCKPDHLETFINMPVFPRSPKDSRKIVKVKREVPFARFFFFSSPEAPSAYVANRKLLAPNHSPEPHLTVQSIYPELCNESFQFGLTTVQSYTHVLLIQDKC